MSQLLGPSAQSFPHHTHFTSADGHHVWHFSGIAILDPALKGTGRSWQHEDIYILLTATDVPAGKKVRLKHWAPHVALNVVYNDHSSQWAGWAVDSFFIGTIGTPSEPPGPFSTRPIEFDDSFTVGARVAVRDVDGWLPRVSYSVDLVGAFVDS